uniref:Gypsy retrotransposon integrase-like protein 1 n=1 Tax=Latimeria chalumnae TaxID=7897 RepID=H2ZTA9_LATCH
HDDAGHQGIPRTLHLARQRFFWVGLERDISDYVHTCSRCVVAKTAEPADRAPLESIRTSAPLELVCFDFWSAEGNKKKNVDVLVVTDHFTKLAHAFPCTGQTFHQVAKKLWDKFLSIYGFPQRIHSDRGAYFESKLLKDLQVIAGIEKSHTTPYHPSGSGCVERFNRTLDNMLRTLPPLAKHKWPQMLYTLTFVYNCTIHETTGFAPFYLMFGRLPPA